MAKDQVRLSWQSAQATDSVLLLIKFCSVHRPTQMARFTGSSRAA